MPIYDHRFRTLATNVVHAGRPDPSIEGAVATPIFQSANYLMADEGDYEAIRYIRLNNSPNHQSLHAKLAALEGGEAGLATASGMAAISAVLMSLLSKGDHLLAQSTLYGGTQTFFDHDLVRWGIETSQVDLADSNSWAAAVTPNTKVFYLESISNPLMEVGEMEEAVAFAREHDLVTVIDNTFATPVNFRPLETGIDVVVHSATKYLNGHSDIVAGAIVGSEDLVAGANSTLVHLGGALDPHAAFLLDRGLKTLELRVRRQNDNAQALAEFLAERDAVREVRYPGLRSDPGHERANRWFDGCGGMLAFYAADDAAAEAFLGRVRIPLHAASLGGVETLVVRPSRSSHLGMDPTDRERLGITDSLIRVSVGIESVEELIEDFDQALAG